MTSAPARDAFAGHLVTPQNAAFVLVAPLATWRVTAGVLVRVCLARPAAWSAN